MKKIFCPYEDCRQEISGDTQAEIILVNRSIGDRCAEQTKSPEFINCPHCGRDVGVTELIVCD